MLEQIKNIIRNNDVGVDCRKNGTFVIEIYPDYRDEMCEKTAVNILESDDIDLAFIESMDDMYSDYAAGLQNDAIAKIEQLMYENGIDIPDEEEFQDICRDLIDIEYPEDHFLNQTYNVPIMLDTGDGNYDFTKNSLYPCWYGEANDPIDPASSLLWLAKQQGYTESKLRKALAKGDISDPHGFIDTVRQECANLASSMSTVTFLVKLSLQDLIKLNRCIRLQDRNGHNYDARENPYCGYIILNKETGCGLFDPWSGGGSVLEIELEKDVRLPIRYIFSALPDLNRHNGRYSIDSVYGLCGSAWTYGGVTEIHEPVTTK